MCKYCITTTKHTVMMVDDCKQRDRNNSRGGGPIPLMFEIVLTPNPNRNGVWWCGGEILKVEAFWCATW
jgi:hypothetical protein